MKAINKQDLINYLKKSPENINFNIFGTMLDDFRNTYETDEQIVDKIKNIITNIIEDGGSISPEDDTITELVDLITELLPEKMIIKPEGTLEITQNGEYDIMNKAGVNVNVAGVINPALVLWDWEGTKLSEYSVEDALELTELPTPSTLPAYATADHDLLIFQEWNWSLANIKTWLQNHKDGTLDVGAIYTTTDGQDHNYWENPRLDIATTITAQKRGTASIGDNAFQNCSALTKVNIPDSVTSIGDNAFDSCFSLTKVNIPDSVSSIGSSAFYSCFSLTKVNIPDSVSSIGSYAFNNCYSLTKVNIPDSVSSIESYAFNNCYSLTKVNIPDSVTSIGNGAFNNCFSLTKVNIPDSVTSIGDSAFNNCFSLTKVNIPDSVTSIGSNAFHGCKCLNDVLLESKPTLSNTNAFSGLPTNYRIYVPRADLSWFETATNWSTIYTQGNIVAIEDYIEYLESLGFNVDKYKG